MSEPYRLYVISFVVGSESGLAMVAACNEKDAFQVLKNSGSRCGKGYQLIQIRDIGMTGGCTYGLLLESFVNARTAFDAIVQVAERIIKGDKGDSVWSNAYVDENLYLHIVEDEVTGVSSHLEFNQQTGYLIIR